MCLTLLSVKLFILYFIKLFTLCSLLTCICSLLTCIYLTAGVNLLTPSTVRFVTSSQRGLTCVGAEYGKEEGGMDHTSVAALTNQLCSDHGVVRVFEYSINVLYYKYGRNQS